MTDNNKYVLYYVSQVKKTTGYVSSFSLQKPEISGHLQKRVQDFLASVGQHEVIGSFVELFDNRKAYRWTELEIAVSLSKEHKAKLVIAELGTLTNSAGFAKTILEGNVEFYCCDQPFVTMSILEALYKHAQVQRKLHGQLIKEGLQHTSAKSGNPNAAKVISEVNKPKIDTAIIFAFILQPIIAEYKRCGFSQRQMVKTLNADGFTAPEGGKWVLSQLQKVLDRVRLNEIACVAKSLIDSLPQNERDEYKIAEALNRNSIVSIKKGGWDGAQVNKLLVRLEQIDDIENSNRFVLDLLRVVKEYKSNGLSIKNIIDKLAVCGVHINTNINVIETEIINQ